MPRPRKEITVSYRILDSNGKTVEVRKETGFNKANIQWKVERYVLKKYGKNHKLHQFRIEEEA